MTLPDSSGRHSAMPLRTAATSECVVPRSMPTAIRRWCGSGAPPGSEICSRAIALLFQRLQTPLDVMGKALDEHQHADFLRGGRVVAIDVEEPFESLQRRLATRPDLLRQGSQLLEGRRLLERLAPLELLHQEARWHRGVLLGGDRRTVQLAQIGCTLQRILQALVSLVDAHRPLHRDAPGGAALGGETVRMHLGLQRAPACVERRSALPEPTIDREQFEVVAVEL